MKCVVYDLPSGNRRQYDPYTKRLIETTRVGCVHILHSLGVGATESVILVPPENYQKLAGAIDEVRARYETVQRRFPDISQLLEPEIRVLTLTGAQTEALKSVAVRRLERLIDVAVERLSDLLEVEIEETRRKRVLYNLNRTRRTWLEIWQNARRLGIRLDRDFEYIISLIDQARERVGG